jgi:hypothetical protein
VLVEASKHAPNLYFKAIGSGLPKLSEYCLPPNVNLRVDDQPDYAYGKWVSSLYRDVMVSGKPTLQEIDAVITWPEKTRTNYRYGAVLPPGGEDNSTMLLGATQLDLLINPRQIRLEFAEVLDQLAGVHPPGSIAGCHSGR